MVSFRELQDGIVEELNKKSFGYVDDMLDVDNFIGEYLKSKDYKFISTKMDVYEGSRARFMTIVFLNYLDQGMSMELSVYTS
jgi:hypothetical protein